MAWCEGKQHVLLKWYIMLIAVIDGVVASANNSKVEITFLLIIVVEKKRIKT